MRNARFCLALALTLVGALAVGGCGEDDEELCYDHTCNGEMTGKQCFSSHVDYCSALCAEDVCSAVAACQSECT